MSLGFKNIDSSQDRQDRQAPSQEAGHGSTWYRQVTDYLLTKQVQQLVLTPEAIRNKDILGRGSLFDITI